MKTDKVKHFLTDHEISSCINMAHQPTMSAGMSIELIKAYIYDVTGKVAPPRINPTPKDKFEKAISIASSYFIILGDIRNYQKEAFPRTEGQFKTVIINGEPIDMTNLTPEQRKKMRDLGIVGV